MAYKWEKEDSKRSYKSFSTFWWSIAKTRLVLCIIIFLLTFKNPSVTDPAQLYILIAIYIVFQLLLGLINLETLELKKVRVIPSLVDIVFISLIIYFTGGPNSSWFLIYIFPIISVSKYLGNKGSLFLACWAIFAYAVLNYLVPLSGSLDFRTFALRSSFFLATGFLAGNLARTKEKEEIKLIKDFEQINNEILLDISIKKALKMILRRALETTGSEMGHLRLIDQKSRTQELKVVAAIGHPSGYNWELRPLDDSLSQKVVILKESLIIPSIKKRDLKKYLGVYFKLHHPRPKSALFVPLIIKGEAIGVLAVYSKRSYHYIKRDSERLAGLAPLVAVALKTAEFNKELNLAVEENKKRLELLYKIGSQLKAELPLNKLFQEVVGLIYEHLNSEEAALFIPDENDDNRIKKVAVKGPTESITRKLEEVELSYTRGESLAGRIFDTKDPIFLKEVDPIVEYVDDYIKILPSKKILHYIGVPLIIGDEILGVIRVINKKAPAYSADDNPELSEAGFEETEDIGLLKTIAIQVAVAIKYTKLLKTEKLAAIGNVAKNVGHEIKTNLGTALQFLEGLRSLHDPEKDAEILEIYTDIQDALWKARNQLQKMLMAAKPKGTEKVVVGIGDIFYEFEGKLKRAAEAAQIDFSVDYPVDSPEFLADVSQIQQIFANLFDNSTYAIQEKMSSDLDFRGRIEVSAHFKDDSLQICWKDNGVGISRQNLPILFTPFFTSKGESGNGLGLFISRSIVENHSGTISVHSTEGEGTVFTIKLPLLQNIGTGERDASNPAG